MKRQDAYKKLRTVCQRVDQLDGEQFTLIPLELYLFGSVLTDKPNPSDLNLLLYYAHHSTYDPEEDYDALISYRYGTSQRMVSHLRKGMLKVDFVLEFSSELASPPAIWYTRGRLLPLDRTPRLVWKPGFDWQLTVDYLEKEPLAWNMELDDCFRQMRDETKRLMKLHGRHTAKDWQVKQGRINYEKFLSTGRVDYCGGTEVSA